MKVIPPIAIAPSSSTVSEPSTGEVVWVPSGQPYKAGDVVIRTATHRKYECLVDHTSVSTAPPESDAINWRDAGPTNKWAMFDLFSSAKTEVAGGPLVVEFAPGRRITSIGLLGMQGASARIEELVSGSPIYDETFNLLLRNTTTWRRYFYGQFRVRENLVRFDLPMSTAATVRVTIQPTAGFARCRAVVVGMDENLGTIIDEPTSDQLSLSKVVRDEIDGTTTFTKRRNVPLTSHRVRAPAGQLNRLRELRDDLDATPALFSGVDDNEDSHFFDTLLVLGFARKWSISMRGERVISELQLEEL
jgi:hypothetical protein